MNYAQLNALGIFTDEDKALEYAYEQGLLKIGAECPEKCGGILELKIKASYSHGYCLRCSKCKKNILAV